MKIQATESLHESPFVMSVRPRLLLTLGDVAGVGPELAARAWRDPELHRLCRPVIVGDVERLRQTLRILRQEGDVIAVSRFNEMEATPARLLCVQATEQNVANLPLGAVNAAAGRA